MHLPIDVVIFTPFIMIQCMQYRNKIYNTLYTYTHTHIYIYIYIYVYIYAYIHDICIHTYIHILF